jgi:regulator of replication initiation timing
MAGHQPSKPFEAPVWHQPDGNPVSCVEKIKVLNENLGELRQMAQDLVEDAILMGCDENQIRAVLDQMIASLQNPYRKS